MHEKRLLQKVIVSHDASAYEVLYDSYVAPIYRFILFKVSNPSDAEDITSDVFLRVWNYLTEKDRPSVRNFRSFVYQVARNAIIDYYRKQATQSAHTEPLDPAAEIATSEDLFVQVADADETRQVLLAIKKLKREYQDVLLLRYIEEYSHKEIAQALGKSPTTVRVTLHRATKKLQDIMKLGS